MTVTDEPVIPSSGLSIADYYEDDLAGDNLSQDLPPQVPAGTAPLPAASTSAPSSAKQNIVGGLTTGSRTSPSNSASSGPTTMLRADARPVSYPAWQPTTKADPPVNAANVVNTSSKNVFGHTWETAPVCSGSPARNNSVQVGYCAPHDVSAATLMRPLYSHFPCTMSCSLKHCKLH